MFRHRSATPAGVTGNGEVRSLGNNVTSIYGSAVNASRHDDCQHHGGRGPAVRGKVNPGEVLIKVVTENKPKMLSGLNQKVSGQVRGLRIIPVADGAPPAERHDLTPGSIEKVNEVTPLSPREGRLPAKKANGIAGRDEGGSECRSVVDRIEGESTHGQHSLTAKAG